MLEKIIQNPGLKGGLQQTLLAVLAGVQHYFQVVTLDPGVYYMSTVPLFFNAWHIILLNAGVLVVTVAALVVPTLRVSRVDPVRSMKFE